MAHDTNCFACGRKLGKKPQRIGCQDDQTADVGADCFKLIKAAGATGYQPPRGGPRLYLLEHTGRIDPDPNMDELQAKYRLPGVIVWRS